jgi:hypothetical protein
VARRNDSSPRRAPARGRTIEDARRARARLYRRRRFGSIFALLLLLVAAVVAWEVAGRTRKAGHHPPTTLHPTTTTLPASFNVGLRTFDWTNTAATHVSPTGAPVPGRGLTTEIRYPTLAGTAGTETVDASPSRVGGPYPVIVFAHGFDTDPATYANLLDTWVAAGMVVVSPIFPDEGAQAVAAAGANNNPTIASALESDVYNEPGDIAFVLKQLENLPNLSGGSALQGVLDLSRVALAGQSDGANVVAGLSFASSLHQIFRSLPVAPKAVAILSGTAWGALGAAPIGTYSAGPASPAVLQVQSDADGCVSPTQAVDLFAQLQGGPEAHWFVTLLGSDHLGPYEGEAPWSAAVSAVTTAFFELELHWRDSALSPASVVTAGTVARVSQVTTSVSSSTMPQVPTNGNCGILAG